MQKYEHYQTVCFDSFKCLKRKITKAVRNVTIEFAAKINEIFNDTKTFRRQRIGDVCRAGVFKF